tara:strand:- start:319 stop:642 length:324 start_codon:yes stop_codon:yes gene_type:complete
MALFYHLKPMNLELVKEEEATRALNQLLSVIVGRRFAMQTDQYKDHPLERIDKCHHLISQEFAEAVGDPKRIVQVQRKMDSLQSLTTLARLAAEIDFDQTIDESSLY